MCEISVIIPSYGIPEYLANSIASVKSQTFSNWELIVVDDNNPETDARKATERLMSELMSADDRIRYIQHDRNRNGAVARNTGFSQAQGQFIALLDSDDEYRPDRLQKCLDAIKKASSNVAGVYTGCEFKRGGKTYHKSTTMKSGNFLKETLACTFGFCTGSNIFVRKSVVDELNGFDPSFLRHQDYEFLVRLFLKYDLVAIPEILVIKNNEGFNVLDFDKTVSIKKQYLGKFAEIIDRMSEDDKNYIYQRQNVAIAEVAMRQKKYREAQKYYKIAGSFGSLTKIDWKRRLVYPIYNILH